MFCIVEQGGYHDIFFVGNICSDIILLDLSDTPILPVNCKGGGMKHKPTILLAEDDDGHAGLILRSLKDAGITNDILCFDNGEDTLDFLFKRGNEPYREEGVSYVLLLDIRLPGINGTEVLRQIKKDKWVNHIPVIMLSVSDDPVEIEQCRKLGCDNYFVKPSTHEKFSNIVENLGYYITATMLSKMSIDNN